MNLNIGGAFDSISRTANQVGHQLGQYVDGQAVGGLLVRSLINIFNYNIIHSFDQGEWI